MVGDTTVGQARGVAAGNPNRSAARSDSVRRRSASSVGVTVGESGWDASPSVTDSIETGTPRAASSDASAPTPRTSSPGAARRRATRGRCGRRGEGRRCARTTPIPGYRRIRSVRRRSVRWRHGVSECVSRWSRDGPFRAGEGGAQIGEVVFGMALPEVDGQVGDQLRMASVAAQRARAEGASHPVDGLRRGRLDHRAHAARADVGCSSVGRIAVQFLRRDVRTQCAAYSAASTAPRWASRNGSSPTRRRSSSATATAPPYQQAATPIAPCQKPAGRGTRRAHRSGRRGRRRSPPRRSRWHPSRPRATCRHGGAARAAQVHREQGALAVRPCRHQCVRAGVSAGAPQLPAVEHVSAVGRARRQRAPAVRRPTRPQFLRAAVTARAVPPGWRPRPRAPRAVERPPGLAVPRPPVRSIAFSSGRSREGPPRRVVGGDGRMHRRRARRHRCSTDSAGRPDPDEWAPWIRGAAIERR